MKQFLLLTTLVAYAAAHHGKAVSLIAEAKLTSPAGSTEVRGTIIFSQQADGKIRVAGAITGLPKGGYGLHVHEKGDLDNGCLNTGAHFNPDHKDHGHPDDEHRHVGDLGNVLFSDIKLAAFDFVDNGISLVGPHSILGRSVVLHEKADDFGRSSHPDSKSTGNAGGRVACGIIGIVSG